MLDNGIEMIEPHLAAAMRGSEITFVGLAI